MKFLKTLFLRLKIKSIHVYQEPFLAGSLKFRQRIEVQYRTFFTDDLIIIFRTEDMNRFYSLTGERWLPPTAFYSALHDFESGLDHVESPLRQEKFEQLLREEE